MKRYKIYLIFGLILTAAMFTNCSLEESPSMSWTMNGTDLPYNPFSGPTAQESPGGENPGGGGNPGGGSTRVLVIDLADGYGDGWNGASLRIQKNHVNQTPNLTIPAGETYNSYTLSVNTYDFISVYWNAKGSYDEECAFVIYYDDDPSSFLVYRLYGELEYTAAGALLGSFTVTSN
ncbi:MAG: hypothetical protein FWB83_01885 [Treponema sp.]|nr:hypothetical protein [Treponema sp.]